MNKNQYGSVITEQGDLGLGVTPIHENKNKTKNEEKNTDKQKDKK